MKKIQSVFIIASVLWVLSTLEICVVAQTASPSENTDPKAGQECYACHSEEVDSFNLTPHGRLQGCSMCHDRAEAHLTEENKTGNIPNPKNMRTEQSNKICLACHENKERDISEKFQAMPNLHDQLSCYECHRPHEISGDSEEDTQESLHEDTTVNCAKCHEENAYRLGQSKHGDAGLECADCHELHSPRTISRDIEEQIDTCFSCHPKEELEFRSPFPHPLRERQVKCSDCHNPHSDQYDAMLKDDTEEVCRKCHADITIEGGRHPESKGTDHPFRSVECLDCHKAHGSNFDKVLIHDESSLCTTCHN